MLLATGRNDVRILAEPGLAGRCPGCLAPVIPKCGDQVTWHWAHRSGDEAGCDPWAESEGEWHLAWKLDARAHGCDLEVTMRRGTEWHRADIVRPDGVVVEVQHSPIGEGEALDREGFYRRHGGLIWLFDANDRWWEQIAWWDDRSGGEWPGYSETIAALQAPMFWDTPDGVVRVRVLEASQGVASVLIGEPVESSELFVPASSTIKPVAEQIPLVASAQAWRFTAVRCWSCGARPSSTFNDRSPLFSCHHDAPELHVPRNLDGSMAEVA